MLKFRCTNTVIIVKGSKPDKNMIYIMCSKNIFNNLTDEHMFEILHV